MITLAAQGRRGGARPGKRQTEQPQAAKLRMGKTVQMVRSDQTWSLSWRGRQPDFLLH